MTRTGTGMANQPWPAQCITPIDVFGTLMPSHVLMREVLSDGGADRGSGAGG